MCEASITFNSINRQFELWQDDEIIEQYDFTQLTTALRHLLQIKDKELYNAAWYLADDLFRFNSDMQERIWAAAQIVLVGGVRPPYYLRDELDTMRVMAELPKDANRDFPYYRPNLHLPVIIVNGQRHCQCFDFKDNPSAPRVDGRTMCKHILAIKLQKMIFRAPITWPIPKSLPSNEIHRIMTDLSYIEIHGLPPETVAIIDRARKRFFERLADRPVNQDMVEFIEKWESNSGKLACAREKAKSIDELNHRREKAETESNYVGISYTWPTLKEQITS